jgi:DNA (cytosine-5)-methyltransferase 1
MPKMTALSFFSGIGGLDPAAEAEDIRTVAMCERDPFCRGGLRHAGRNFFRFAGE